MSMRQQFNDKNNKKKNIDYRGKQKILNNRQKYIQQTQLIAIWKSAPLELLRLYNNHYFVMV